MVREVSAGSWVEVRGQTRQHSVYPLSVVVGVAKAEHEVPMAVTVVQGAVEEAAQTRPITDAEAVEHQVKETMVAMASMRPMLPVGQAVVEVVLER